jgi:hypothetical protein
MLATQECIECREGEKHFEILFFPLACSDDWGVFVHWMTLVIMTDESPNSYLLNSECSL